MGWSLEEARQASKSSIPVKSHNTCSIPPASNVTSWEKCCLPGKLITDLVPKVFTGAWLARHPQPVHTKVPDSQRKAGVPHYPYSTHKTFRHSRSSLPVREWWENSPNQVPRCQPRVNLARRTFWGKAEAYYVNTLLHILTFPVTAQHIIQNSRAAFEIALVNVC